MANSIQHLKEFEGHEPLQNLAERKEDPRQWHDSKRKRAIVCIGMFAFMEPLASSMVAPSLDLIADEFNITSFVERNLVLSAFVLPYAIGCVIFAPISETTGRKPVILATALIFFAFNLGCGFARSSAQLIVLRVMAGLGASSAIAIGTSVVGDCYAPHERASAMSIYIAMQIGGPAVGPIIAGAIAQTISSWRWAFWSTSIATAVILILGAILMPETYAMKLNRVDQVPMYRRLGTLKRPFVLLSTQPILQVLAAYAMVIFGTYYLFLTTLVTVFRNTYGQSVLISSLHYLALLLGFVASTVISRTAMDYLYQRFAQDGHFPEARMPALAASATFLPAGLLLYGWAAQYKVFWFVPDIGLFLIGLGIPASLSTVQHYILDCYSDRGHVASALAGWNVARLLAGFGFPLFADNLYESLGLGWGNSLLALIAVVTGALSVTLWRFGLILRSRSSLADAKG